MARMVCVLSALGALAFTSGALAESSWQFINLRKGDVGVFHPSDWSCRNLGAKVECQTGDAYPYVTLTSGRGGVTVKVTTLKGSQAGSVRKTRNRAGYPVW